MLSDECQLERPNRKKIGLAAVVHSGGCHCSRILLDSGTSLALDTGVSCDGRRLPGQCHPLWPVALLPHWPTLHSRGSVRCAVRVRCSPLTPWPVPADCAGGIVPSSMSGNAVR